MPRKDSPEQVPGQVQEQGQLQAAGNIRQEPPRVLNHTAALALQVREQDSAPSEENLPSTSVSGRQLRAG